MCNVQYIENFMYFMINTSVFPSSFCGLLFHMHSINIPKYRVLNGAAI